MGAARRRSTIHHHHQARMAAEKCEKKEQAMEKKRVELEEKFVEKEAEMKKKFGKESAKREEIEKTLSWMKAKYDTDAKGWKEEKQKLHDELALRESWYSEDNREKNLIAMNKMKNKLADLGLNLIMTDADPVKWFFDGDLAEGSTYESAEEGTEKMDDEK